MLTQQIVISNLKKMAFEIKQAGIHLNKIILYGSYSRNAQNTHSDIDIAIVADEFKSIGFEDVHLLSKILRNYDGMNI